MVRATWRAILLSGGACLAACGSFGEADPPRPAPAPLPPAPSPADGGAVEAGADASASQCGMNRQPALVCGAKTCRPENDEACCVESPRRCGARVDGVGSLPTCPSTQWNCLGKADCEGALLCCQTGMNVGAQCLPDCVGRLRYCHRSDECDPGEGCMPLAGAPPEVWACTPCR